MQWDGNTNVARVASNYWKELALTSFELHEQRSKGMMATGLASLSAYQAENIRNLALCQAARNPRPGERTKNDIKLPVSVSKRSSSTTKFAQLKHTMDRNTARFPPSFVGMKISRNSA